MLKFVYRHYARLPGFLQACEDLFQSVLRPVYVTEFQGKRRKSADRVESKFPADGFQGTDQQTDHPAVRGCQAVEDFLSQKVCEFFKSGSVEDVDEEPMVSVQFSLAVAELNQACLAHAPRGHKHHVVAVRQRFDQSGRLIAAVAEVFRVNAAGDDERILCSIHTLFILLQM